MYSQPSDQDGQARQTPLFEPLPPLPPNSGPTSFDPDPTLYPEGSYAPYGWVRPTVLAASWEREPRLEEQRGDEMEEEGRRVSFADTLSFAQPAEASYTHSPMDQFHLPHQSRSPESFQFSHQFDDRLPPTPLLSSFPLPPVPPMQSLYDSAPGSNWNGYSRPHHYAVSPTTYRPSSVGLVRPLASHRPQSYPSYDSPRPSLSSLNTTFRQPPHPAAEYGVSPESFAHPSAQLFDFHPQPRDNDEGPSARGGLIRVNFKEEDNSTSPTSASFLSNSPKTPLSTTTDDVPLTLDTQSVSLSDLRDVRRVVESTKTWLGTNRTKRVEKREEVEGGEEGGRGGGPRIGKKRMADNEMGLGEDGMGDDDEKRKNKRYRSIQNSRRFRDKRKEYIFSLESNLSKALDLVGMLVDRLEGGDSVNGVEEHAREEEWEE